MAKVQFDRTEVLKNASDTFWRLGFNATSMQTVFEKTGLKPGSVYLAFGNKEGLFKESLDYYANQSLTKLESIFLQYDVAEEAIYKILIMLIEESCETQYCSCFLIKSQLELGQQQWELKNYVSQHLREIELLYVKYLLKSNTNDEAKIKAASIMLHIFGIRVYGYHHNSREQLIDALHIGLPWLKLMSHH